MQEFKFDDAVEKILQQDARYPRDAYVFLKEALDLTKKINQRATLGKTRQRAAPAELLDGHHVTPAELLDGLRLCALQQFGPMAVTVLAEWGVLSCKDFGELVFNMIDIGLFGKSPTDSREDFQNGYDFSDAFEKPFWPERRLRAELKKQPL